MSQIVNIVSGGCLGDQSFFQEKIARMENCLIICCDGGVRHFQYLGIKPDVILGDLDSIDPASLASYSTQGIKIIKYPAKKRFYGYRTGARLRAGFETGGYIYLGCFGR